MKSVGSVVLLPALLLSSASTALEYSSLAEEQAYRVRDNVLEILSCLTENVSGIAGNLMPMSRAIAVGIADSSRSGEVVDDARLFSQDRDISLEHVEKLDAAGQVQLALNSLAMVHVDQDVEPTIRFGAQAALLIHATKATNGSCVASNRLWVSYLTAVSVLRNSDDDLVFDPAAIGNGDGITCERYDMQTVLLSDRRYLVNEIEVDHDELVRMIASRREAEPDFHCIKLLSEQSGVPEEVVMALSDLGVRITWKRNP